MIIYFIVILFLTNHNGNETSPFFLSHSQWCTKNPVGHLQWNFFRKHLAENMLDRRLIFRHRTVNLLP